MKLSQSVGRLTLPGMRLSSKLDCFTSFKF
jgi:hypothetical protein